MRKLSAIIMCAAVMLAACAFGGGKMTQIPVALGTNASVTVSVGNLSGWLDEIAVYAPTLADTGTVAAVTIHPGGTNVVSVLSADVTGVLLVRPYSTWTDGEGFALTNSVAAIAATSDVPISAVSALTVPRGIYLYGEAFAVTVGGCDTGKTWKVWVKTRD